MVYSLTKYAEIIAKCHVNTLKMRIKKDQLPSTHKVKMLGTNYSIEIIHGSEHCRACDNLHHAGLEYQELKKPFDVAHNRQVAASVCIKYDINTVKFFKMMGVK